jgi:hypothetical protein
VSNDNNVIPEISSPEKSEAPVNLKAWHRPVVSRIEIAQTLHSSGAPAGDTDNGLGS